MKENPEMFQWVGFRPGMRKIICVRVALYITTLHLLIIFIYFSLSDLRTSKSVPLQAAEKAAAIATMVFKDEAKMTTEKLIELSTRHSGLQRQFRQEVEKLRKNKSTEMSPMEEIHLVLNRPKKLVLPVRRAKLNHKFVTYK